MSNMSSDVYVYEALHTYKPQEEEGEDFIPLDKKDILEVKCPITGEVDPKNPQTWLKGTNITKNKTGYFPGNFVRFVEIKSVVDTEAKMNTEDSSGNEDQEMESEAPNILNVLTHARNRYRSSCNIPDTGPLVTFQIQASCNIPDTGPLVTFQIQASCNIPDTGPLIPVVVGRHDRVRHDLNVTAINEYVVSEALLLSNFKDIKKSSPQDLVFCSLFGIDLKKYKNRLKKETFTRIIRTCNFSLIPVDDGLEPITFDIAVSVVRTCNFSLIPVDDVLFIDIYVIIMSDHKSSGLVKLRILPNGLLEPTCKMPNLTYSKSQQYIFLPITYFNDGVFLIILKYESKDNYKTTLSISRIKPQHHITDNPKVTTEYQGSTILLPLVYNKWINTEKKLIS
ncbi:hypothetical protein KUTeg_015995 [Tegillarca granosa]|uniref:SH3 domain-containing protein n=1 Tax=Tegillarca granosa TaxID=220873 RepID=A0ABQ9EJT2_TEGGR|nr:hypothetical protein KUTeg_015995 [Tegillarca granosa]